MTGPNFRWRPLSQGPFKTEARRALHRDGWTESFDKLAELVTQQR
jgi:uncharacterized protein YndB with AHSA1/START domain